MDLTVRAYHRAADIVKYNSEIQDGDIVLLPDPGPSQGLLAIKAEFNGEMRIRKLTRALGEVLDSRDVEENQQALAQPRYAPSVTAALAIVNQSNDTIIPYYSPRFRLLDHYILGRTRERKEYRHSALISELSWKVLRVWYGDDAPTPDNFVGLIFPSAPHGDLPAAWFPTHGSGLHSGMSLGGFPDSHQAADELIRFDLAATAELPQTNAQDDGVAVGPVSYDPMLED